jgi:hypothetical protein
MRRDPEAKSPALGKADNELGLGTNRQLSNFLPYRGFLGQDLRHQAFSGNVFPLSFLRKQATRVQPSFLRSEEGPSLSSAGGVSPLEQMFFVSIVHMPM